MDMNQAQPSGPPPASPSPPPPGAPHPSAASGWQSPAPAQTAGRPPGRRIQKRWIVVAVVSLGLGAYGIQTWQQEQNYQAGHAAYLTADCTTAIGPLRSAAEGDPGSPSNDTAGKAEAELEECEAILAAADLVTQGRPGEAVLAYSGFITTYPRSPLKDTALAGGQGVLAGGPERAATVGLCDELEILEAMQFITAPDETLPPLLYACGQAYEAEGAYADALLTYERFRTDYAGHDLARDVDEAFARATLAETDESGAGSLPAPEETGAGTGTGLATVFIQNDSPDELNMVFSGPDVQIEMLDACAECVEFIGEEPDECPGLGPIGEYIVEPGTYEVVVKSSSGGFVIPFRGTWTLEAGQEYASCFYIVTD
jgi:hypothetical protein